MAKAENIGKSKASPSSARHADSKGRAPASKPVTKGIVGATSPEHVGNRSASDSHRGPVSD